jgi:signal transduction histidine kinase
MSTTAEDRTAAKPAPAAPNRESLSMPEWIILTTALFIILNALSVCIGWWIDVPILVQLSPDDAPTHFNTGLGFVLLGCGELGLVLQRRNLVTCAAAAVLLLAAGETAEWVLGAEFGIDTLFTTPFIAADAVHPGRMSPNTMACFALVGGAQLLMSTRGRHAAIATTAAVVMKTAAGGIAFIALLGYIVQLKAAYGWADSVGMSIRTWAGFLLIIIARIAAIWKRDIVAQPKLPQWFLPFFATAAASLPVGLIWIFDSPAARPFMNDPAYAASAGRISLVTGLSVGALIVLATISVLVARHKAEMALKHASELGVQVMKRMEAELELRSNNRHLTRSNQDLEDFAYVASHDLKAPLRGIDSAAKWLEEDLQGSLSEETRKLLGLMRNRIDRMERLLDDLLDYSRAGRSDATIRETHVGEMIENIVGVLNPPPHIKVRIQGELPVIATANGQLEQVLRNLINNAIKHHDKETGEVVIAGDLRGDVVEFSVRDDGPGIRPEYHEKIFKLFQTLKRRDEVEGSGMGLAIVKKLVEQQNGTITVHSQGDGRGTEFRFEWPAQGGSGFVEIQLPPTGLQSKAIPVKSGLPA